VNINPPNQDPKIPKRADLSAQSLRDAAPDTMLVVNRVGKIVVANLEVEQLPSAGWT
jgi:hypothetical protein